jgi:hypothetical protein
MVHTPWAGLAALVAMFVLPFVPAWWFEGPRTVKHWPRRHVCGDCGAPWAGDHICASPGPVEVGGPPVRGELGRPPVGGELGRPRVRGELRRLPQAAELGRRPGGGALVVRRGRSR